MDPEGQITSFGLSAGAADILTIATLPEVPSSVEAAISESGDSRDGPLKDTADALECELCQCSWMQNQ